MDGIIDIFVIMSNLVHKHWLLKDAHAENDNSPRYHAALHLIPCLLVELFPHLLGVKPHYRSMLLHGCNTERSSAVRPILCFTAISRDCECRLFSKSVVFDIEGSLVIKVRHMH